MTDQKSTKPVEKLSAIECWQEYAHVYSCRIAAATKTASFDEVKEHYARVHGMLAEDIGDDPRFPWHSAYKLGDGKKCCENCAELESALGAMACCVSQDHPLISRLPEFAKLAAWLAAEDAKREAAEAARLADTSGRSDYATWLADVKQEMINIVFTEEEADARIRMSAEWYRKQYDLNRSVQETAERGTGH